MKLRLALATVVLGSVAGLAILEGGVRLYAAIRNLTEDSGAGSAGGAAGPVRQYGADPALGHRPDPAWPGHDRRGWRNEAALDRADIVVLGDSQTYGLNVETDQAWPQQLGLDLPATVYQIAFGGYGPAHYVVLLDEALALRPRAIAAAYYFGNDLWDSYSLVHRAGALPRTAPHEALDAWAAIEPEAKAVLEWADRIDPKMVRHGYLDCQVPREIPDSRLQMVENVLDLPPLGELADPIGTRAKRWLLDHLAVYNEIDRRLRLWFPDERTVAEYGPPLCVAFRDHRTDPIFNAGMRLTAVTETDPRIVEGQAISLKAFRYIADRLTAEGVAFYVVLIPTKELAFRSYVAELIGPQEYLEKQWAAERAWREEAIQVLRSEGIAVIDSLPVLEAAIEDGPNPYRANSPDGHPVGVGYAAIARAVRTQLRADGW